MITEDYSRLATAPHPVDARTLNQTPSAVKGLLEQLALKQREVRGLEYAIWTLQSTCQHSESEKYLGHKIGDCPVCGYTHGSRESIDRLCSY